MMKKWLIEIGCVAVMALSVAIAGAQQQAPASNTPTLQAQSSQTPAAEGATTPGTAPSPTPAATTHQPSPAETAVAQFTPTNDPKEIVRRSMEIDRRTLELMRNYTCQQREVIKHLDKQGNVKSTEVKTYDVGFYYGEE
jgi:hypothetical protein